jgi:hypothetical protein
MRKHRDCFAYVLRNKPSPPSSRTELHMGLTMSCARCSLAKQGVAKSLDPVRPDRRSSAEFFAAKFPGFIFLEPGDGFESLGVHPFQPRSRVRSPALKKAKRPPSCLGVGGGQISSD